LNSPIARVFPPPLCHLIAAHTEKGISMKAKNVLIAAAVLTFVALSWSSAQAWPGVRIGFGGPIRVGVGVGLAYPAPYYYQPYRYYGGSPYYYSPYRYRYSPYSYGYAPYRYGYSAPARVYMQQPGPVYTQPAPTQQRSYYPSSMSPTPATVPPPPSPATVPSPPTPAPAATAPTSLPPSSAPQPVAPPT